MMMKKQASLAPLLIAAISGAALAAPADPKDMKDIQVQTTAPQPINNPFYVAVYGGANFSQNYGNDHASASIPGFGGGSAKGANSGDWGSVGGVKFGYEFRAWEYRKFHITPALEVEGLYLGSGLNSSYGINLKGTSFTSNSHTNFNDAALFVNGILNFKNESMFTPYLGVGVGGEYVNADETHSQLAADGATVGSGTNHANDIDFAVQGIAGLNARLNEHWSLFTEYKFIAVINPSLNYSNVAQTGTDYRFHPDYIGQHIVTAGVKYNF